MTNYSKYKTFFEVEPRLERKANQIINRMGNNLILEGATSIGDGRFRVWFRNITKGKDFDRFDCKIFSETDVDILEDKDDSVIQVEESETIKETEQKVSNINFFVFH